MPRLAKNAEEAFAVASAMTQAAAQPWLDLLSLGFEVEWFSESVCGNSSWLALVKPDVVAGAHLGLVRPCIVVGVGPGASLSQLLAESVPSAIEDLADCGVRLIVIGESTSESLCIAWGITQGIRVGLLKAPLRDASPDLNTAQTLFRSLAPTLWSQDPFDNTGAAVGSEAYFGRTLAVVEVLRQLRVGNSVALLGMRKIGKSAILQQLGQAASADSSTLWVVSALDGGRLKRGRWWSACQEALGNWCAALTNVAQEAASPVKPQVGRLAAAIAKRVSDPSRLAEAFEEDVLSVVRAAHAVNKSLGRQSVVLTLLIDEIDSLYPHCGDVQYWRDDYFSLWDALNATRQRLVGQACLVAAVSASEPSGIELGALLGRANPAYIPDRFYVAPLTLEAASELMQRTGARVGISFEGPAIELMWKLSGGVPLLLRRMGSAIHSARINRTDVLRVDAAEVEKVYSRRRLDLQNQASWILECFAKSCPAEYQLLRDIAVKGGGAFLGEWSGHELRDTLAYNLERYGFVEFGGEAPVIRARLMQDSLRRPTVGAFADQKRQLRDIVDNVEGAIRARIAADLQHSRSRADAVEAVASAIPADAKNRPKNRAQLVQLGESAGLLAMLESLNWGDYENILTKYYDEISWGGPLAERGDRLKAICDMFRDAHLVRHNNDRELGNVIRECGFAAVFARFRDVLELLPR
jgi:hypothetical protein